MHRFRPAASTFLANVEAGNGIGILADGDQGDVSGLNYLLQGTYKFSDKSKVGVSYGMSKNDDNKALQRHLERQLQIEREPDRRSATTR